MPMKKIPCIICGLPSHARQLCNVHYRRKQRAGDFGENKPRRTPGQGWITDEGYHKSNIKGSIMLTHRRIMEDHLGRKLLPEENIHHINGDRLDNRLENLELWNTSQPAGQRIEDKVSWAKEIIAQYEIVDLDQVDIRELR